MLRPLLIIVPAVAMAGVMAYGTDPRWASNSLGIDLIMHVRRLQWPLAFVSLGLCLGLIVMVTSGRRRAWWLLGLAPVLFLFVQRFSLSSVNRLAVWEEPLFVLPENAPFLQSDDYVVGLVFGDQAYAYPYAALYRTPVIVQSDRDKRMLLIWSAQANRAVGQRISRELMARDLEVVASPAGALLLYNTRLGQFINGLTGVTPDGARPLGFETPLLVTRMTWRAWREIHPQTQVMMPIDGRATRPNAPLLPPQGLAAGDVIAPETPIVFIAADTPVGLLDEGVTATPLNLMAGDVPIMVVRDERGIVRAFDRRMEPDLFPRFDLCRDPRRRGAAYVDADTDTGWSAEGVAVDGPRKGQSLVPISAEPDLYWGVMKHWYPQLELRRSPERPN
jgi:hypothetical protein